MKHLNFKKFLSLFPAFLFFLLEIGLPTKVSGAVNTFALETSPWNVVAESSIIDENGWLQSLCATDQYIVCLINGAKKTTEPDTLIAFYRNTTDADGNPVEQYSYAFHVTETDYEHGNGMTYNPKTQEIVIAGLFTNDSSNAGAVFVVDANTLKFKRKVTVGSGKWNYFGIDYIPEKDQYVLMTNRTADYSFVFTDSNFQITEVMNLGLSSSRSSFQDFIVSGDSIISIPYMQRYGYMNVLDVYSISRKQRIGSYYLTLPGHGSFDVEPEGICQLEPGHLLIASAILGTTNFKLHESYLPVVYSVNTSVENGTISDSSLLVPEGESYTVYYTPDENFRLKTLTVDGQEQNIRDYPSEYTFTDIRTDHTISSVFEEIPYYRVTASALHGTITRDSTAAEHESLTVSFSPENHYELDSLLVDDVPVTLNGDETSYTFDDLTSDHSIQVTFKEIPSYTIQVTAKNGTVEETQATVFRDETYVIQTAPNPSYSLLKCLVDGKRTRLKNIDGTMVLENIQGNHTVQLIYGRIWLRLILSLGLTVSVILPVSLFLRVRRRRKRRQRIRELRRLRRSSKYFFNALDELEELEQQHGQNPDAQEKYRSLMAELGISDSGDDDTL